MIIHQNKTLAIGASILALSFILAGCSGSKGSESTVDSKPFTMWDPYPQFDKSSAWTTTLNSCATDAGVTITRDSMDQSSLTSKLLLAAQQKNAPDIAVIDNPLVASVAETGLLATTDQLGIDTSSMLPNILAAANLNGKTYGVPVGSNTLALFYNKKIISALGVKPPTNWAQLKAAVAAAKNAGHQGIGFSAVATEEGTFQFLPFFWGAGAVLTKLDSPQALTALTLWTDFIKNGEASSSVLNSTQADINDQFLAGNLAFQVNGSWQLAGLDKGNIDYGVVPVPGIDGGSAPAPLGGEFFTLPVNSKADRQDKAVKIVKCMTNPEKAKGWVAGLTYLLPEAAVQKQQVQKSPELAPFVDAVAAAKGRTADLGTKYPKYSEQLWTALQESISGTKTPEQALQKAQAAATVG